MNKRIFETTLKSYQVRRPFKPFSIELSSGPILTIRRPEAVHTYAGSAILIEPDGAFTIFDAHGVTSFTDRTSRRTSN